jgi:hypothetical protein
MFKKARELKGNGITTQGTITDLWKESRFRGLYTIYRAAYRFGAGYEGIKKIRSDDFSKLRVGDKVNIHYLSKDPNYSKMEIRPYREAIENPHSTLGGIFFSITLGIASLVGLIFFLIMILRGSSAEWSQWGLLVCFLLNRRESPALWAGMNRHLSRGF